MPGRVALPANGNPATTSQLMSFVLPDSAGPSYPSGVAGTPQTILGWSLAESTGSAATKLRFHDGTSSSAPILDAEIELAAGGTSDQEFTDGIEVNSGSVWLEVVSGSVEVVLYW
jgi:hypothetical protein